jgi:hypothetical protein
MNDKQLNLENLVKIAFYPKGLTNFRAGEGYDSGLWAFFDITKYLVYASALVQGYDSFIK